MIRPLKHHDIFGMPVKNNKIREFQLNTPEIDEDNMGGSLFNTFDKSEKSLVLPQIKVFQNDLRGGDFIKQLYQAKQLLTDQ